MSARSMIADMTVLPALGILVVVVRLWASLKWLSMLLYFLVFIIL